MPSFRDQITVFIQKELSPEANRQRLISAAKEGIAEAVASGQASSKYDTVVDRSGNKPIEQAQHDILFRFGYALEAVKFALGYLAIRSAPQVSGKFAKSFWVSVDDRYYPPGQFNPNDVQPFSEVVIGNTQPYSRKIDVQLSGGHRLRYRTPIGLYEDCATAIKRQFGNVVSAKRVYDYGFPGRYTPRHAGYQFQSPAVLLVPFAG